MAQPSSAAVTCVKKLLRDVADGREGEKFLALVPLDPTNILKLRGIILAPPGSPMEGYILFLDVDIPDEYPFLPPKVVFKNKIWHPKISKDGKICLPDLSRENWRPYDHNRFENTLVSIQFLLKDVGAIEEFCFNQDALKQYLDDRDKYVRTSKRQTEQDNEGYGRVRFSDYRISAIQSILKIPGVVKYKGYVFCRKESELTWKLILVVVPNLTWYWDHAELTFQRCRKLTTFDFEFENDKITVDFGNRMTKDHCWEITSLNSLEIKKKEVICDPRTSEPATCELQLHWVRPEMKPQRVIHRFTIIGPQHSFDVCVDPDSFSGASARREMFPTERPTLEDLLKFPVDNGKSHIDVLKEIGIEYKKFGVLLLEDERGNKVRSIISQWREDPENINHEIVGQWLNGKGKQPVTWKTLVEVLHASNLSYIAEIIEASSLVRNPEPLM